MSPGIPQLRVTHVGLISYPPGSLFGPRTMSEFELVWILEGGAEYRWKPASRPGPLEETTPHVLESDGFGLCRPSTLDAFRWNPERGVRHAYVHFQLPNHPADWPELADWPTTRSGDATELLRPLFKNLLKLSQALERADLASDTRASLERRMSLTLSHLLHEFVLGTSLPPLREAARWPERVQGMLRLIQVHLDRDPQNPISISDLAEQLNLTPAHLSRLVRNSTGHTPQTCLRLARLDRSLSLLAQTNFSIAQVSERCGFAHPFHFSRCFKDAFGQSPKALRQALERGDALPVPRLKQWVQAQEFTRSS